MITGMFLMILIPLGKMLYEQIDFESQRDILRT